MPMRMATMPGMAAMVMAITAITVGMCRTRARWW